MVVSVSLLLSFIHILPVILLNSIIIVSAFYTCLLPWHFVYSVSGIYLFTVETSLGLDKPAFNMFCVCSNSFLF